ncbi:YidC/Oxa1 family membrane protein insertase [Nocardiopsis ansamitocini]|uniref:Membrane protein insertase YidC n=1 Tax=Nocardiopsis ansamitocini TaxID=1670832 RepID=A0A9W6UIS1_9ACTN|nr:membrane protein insertase YidC [Nocardiopsis ansamitocini]GLU47330.1 membrane protein [Nocardiopsis ansamitocini]
MYSFGPIAVLVTIAYATVTALTGGLAPLFGTAAGAAAIVCLTVLVRLVLLPLSYLQVRAEKTRARLAPQLAALRERHARKPEVLVQETRKLYAKEKTSPLAGCLPTLAQMPLFIAVYGLFVTAEIGGGANELLTHRLGGTPLGSTLLPLDAGSLPVFAVLIVLLALIAWATRRWLTLPAFAQNASAGQPPVPGMAMMSYLPYGMIAALAVVPVAAGVYMVATGVWTLAERLILRRFVTG